MDTGNQLLGGDEEKEGEGTAGGWDLNLDSHDFEASMPSLAAIAPPLPYLLFRLRVFHSLWDQQYPSVPM